MAEPTATRPARRLLLECSGACGDLGTFIQQSHRRDRHCRPRASRGVGASRDARAAQRGSDRPLSAAPRLRRFASSRASSPSRIKRQMVAHVDISPRSLSWLRLARRAKRLTANTFFGLWWLDPAIALAISAVCVREGQKAWRGEQCGLCHLLLGAA